MYHEFPIIMNALRRRLTQATSSPGRPAARCISFTCRGEPIQHEQLFEYTNGRFLVNETRKKAERYAKFDIDALCMLVSSLPSVSSPISKIDKLEGGFNKALLMTAENGKEVIAKIPVPRIVPPWCSTASEVAILDFVRRYTSVPVPKVLMWSSDVSSPVGSEYIVMERSPGRQLVEVWGEMKQSSQIKLIQNLVRLESNLASLEFPGHGNLYFRDSISQHRGRVIPVDDVYCIGPAYHDSWFPQFGDGKEAGPWNSLADLGLSLAKRGTWNIQNTKPTIACGPHYGSRHDHLQALENAAKIIPVLADHPTLHRFSKPTLWHTDLHLGNIFVSDHDPTEIVGIIDWQFTSIMPAFLQVQWPEFLTPPENYQVGVVKPELPENFDKMDAEEKAFAILQRDKAILSKRYEAALAKHHHESYLALVGLNRSVQHLFSSCERTYKGGIIPLRDSLFRISETWQQIGLPRSCPYTCTHDELSKHVEELQRYTDWHTLWGYTQTLLYTDKEGWVSPQLDFDEVKRRHDELFQLYMQGETEVISEEEARNLWFYIENVD